MTVTANDLVNDTENHLLGGDRDQLNRLTTALDLETMYVWTAATTSATVQRGMLGTTPAPHNAGSVVYVNPKFSRSTIFDHLNIELRDLSAPPNGLWQTKEFTLTTFPVQRTYAVPAAHANLIDVLEIRWQPPGPDYRWSRIWRRDYQVIRELDPFDTQAGIGGAPAGIVIRIDPALYPGRHLRVRYAAPFSELSSLSDDVIRTTGLPSTALDIPPLVAAARLMALREAKRNFVEAQGDPRRSAEVPSGGAAKAAQALTAVANERIRTEYMRLQSQYPQLR